MQVRRPGIAVTGPLPARRLRATLRGFSHAFSPPHEDPRFTLRVYAQATKRRERLAKPQRDAFDRAIEWARMGTADDLTVPVSVTASVS